MHREPPLYRLPNIPLFPFKLGVMDWKGIMPAKKLQVLDCRFYKSCPVCLTMPVPDLDAVRTGTEADSIVAGEVTGPASFK